MKKLVKKRLLVVSLVMLLPACASLNISNIFQSYDQQIWPIKQAMHVGDFDQAQQLVAEKNIASKSAVLALLEQGRLEFLNRQWQASNHSFEKAYQLIELENNKAKLQISKGVENLGAVVSNDNAIRYQPAHYEQSMLHSYKALNYLFEHNLEAALVEVRRANLVQKEALARHETALLAAKNTLQQQGVSSASVLDGYPSMAAQIGSIKNGFQNAFTFYLSGFLYEAAGELNDAYIDYRRALEIFPENEYLQQDVLRLATQLDMSDDLIALEKTYGSYQAQKNDKTGQVVIIFEQGIVQSKQDVRLDLPVERSSGDWKFLSFALPVYKQALAQNRNLIAYAQGQRYESKEIVRVQSLAAKALEEQLPALLTRQVARVIAKEQVRQKLSKEAGDVGNILASIYNIASEQADTRSWSTLVDEVDIMRLSLPKGKQWLTVEVNGQSKQLSVDVSAQSFSLIKVTAIDSYVDYQQIEL